MNETHIWSFRGLEEVQGWRFLARCSGLQGSTPVVLNEGVPEDAAPTSLCLCRSPTILRRPETEFNSMSLKDKKQKKEKWNSETCDQNRKNEPTFWTKKMESAQSQDLLLLQEPPGSSRGRRASNMESMEHWITWWLANPMPRPKPVGIHPPFVCLSNCGGTGQGIQRQAPNCNCISALRTTCGWFGNTPGHKLALWKVASRAELRKSYMHLHAMHGIIF